MVRGKSFARWGIILKKARPLEFGFVYDMLPGSSATPTTMPSHDSESSQDVKGRSQDSKALQGATAFEWVSSGQEAIFSSPAICWFSRLVSGCSK